MEAVQYIVEREFTTNFNYRYFIRIYWKYKIKTNNVDKYVIKESHSYLTHLCYTISFTHFCVHSYYYFFIIYYRDAFLFVFNIIGWAISLCLLVTLLNALVCSGWRLNFCWMNWECANCFTPVDVSPIPTTNISWYGVQLGLPCDFGYIVVVGMELICM